MVCNIRVYSDIHQEYQTKNDKVAKFLRTPFHMAEYQDEKQQTLVIAGDLLYLKDLKDDRYIKYLEDLASRFKNVIYVFGNHEFYMYKLGKNYILKVVNILSHIKNLHILSRYTPSVVIDGVKFVGATLWTDLNYDAKLYHYYEDTTGDFKYIRYNDGPYFTKYRSNHWLKEHIADFSWIKNEVINSVEPIVVVSHHAPTSITTDPVDDPKSEYTQFYTSNLDKFILDNPKIKTWIHGHIHYPFDYYMGTTRIFSNPKDYHISTDDNPERSFIQIIS